MDVSHYRGFGVLGFWGFGQKLIEMFAKKLRAEKFVSNKNGYSVELHIKKFTLQK